MKSGRYATVYMIRTEEARYALRVFTQEVRDIAERYAIIVSYLKEKSMPSVVLPDFRPGTRDRGILVAGNWYPYIKMPWVEGLHLKDWVEAQLRRGAPSALLSLAEQWVKLVFQLKQNGIAHGDLQSGNILVDEMGIIHLVDLDGMYVPGLNGRLSVGIGLTSYQHPKREPRHFGPHLDDFSAVLIAVSLHALAEHPELRRRDFDGRKLDDDDILFTRRDLEEPETSLLFQQLLASQDSEVVRLARVLEAACRNSYDEVPCVTGVLDPTVVQERAFAALAAACASEDDGLIAKTWEENPILLSYPPCAHPAVHNRVVVAQQRISCRSAVLRAIEEDDDGKIAAAADALGNMGGLGSLRQADEWRVGLARTRLHLLERLRRSYWLGDEEVLRRWRPNMLLPCRQLGQRDRVRVYVAQRTERMQRRVRNAIESGDHISAALAFDPYLAARRSCFEDEEMAEMDLAQSKLAEVRRQWQNTLASESKSDRTNTGMGSSSRD
jgi:hypothetical protein